MCFIIIIIISYCHFLKKYLHIYLFILKMEVLYEDF